MLGRLRRKWSRLKDLLTRLEKLDHIEAALGHLMPDGGVEVAVMHRGERVVFVLGDYPVDFIQRQIGTYRAFYESQMLDQVCDRVQMRGRVVVDVGANIGNHSLYFKKIAGASQVVSFEPQFDVYADLIRNLKANGMSPDSAYNCPLSEREAKLSLSKPSYRNSGGGVFSADPAGGFEARTLDSFHIQPHLLKIDVEGHELQVLRGATDTLAETQWVWVEAFGPSQGDVDQLLGGAGFKLDRRLPAGNFLYRR